MALRWCAALVAAWTAAVVAIAPVGALAAETDAGTPAYGLRPTLYGRTTLSGGHFRYDVAPGATVRDGVDVFNFSPAQLTLSLYAANVVATPDGRIAPAQPAQSDHGVATWIRLDNSAVTLLPHQQHTEPFTVSIPPTATPGDYVGTVVGAMQGGPLVDGGVVAVTRVALEVQVHVLGEIKPALALSRLHVSGSGGRRQLSLAVINRGNVLTTPAATVEVTGAGGRQTITLEPNDVYLIPGGQVTLRASWTDTPILGRVHLRPVVGAVVEGKVAATYSGDTVTLAFIPWRQTVCVLAAFLVFIAVALFTRRRIQSSRQRRAEERAIVAEWRRTHPRQAA